MEKLTSALAALRLGIGCVCLGNFSFDVVSRQKNLWSRLHNLRLIKSFNGHAFFLGFLFHHLYNGLFNAV